MRILARSKDRTAAYNDAVQALRVLLAEGGSPERAAAEVLADDHEAGWRRDGYTRTRGQTTIWRLPGVVNRPPGSYPERPPGTDHPTLFNRRGRPALYLSEPYNLSLDHVRDMVAFADRHELTFTITNHLGLHFPGVCLTIHWTTH